MEGWQVSFFWMSQSPFVRRRVSGLIQSYELYIIQITQFMTGCLEERHLGEGVVVVG